MSPSLHDLIAEIDAKAKAREDAIAACVAEGERPVQVESRHGWTLLVSRDPSRPAHWRLTRFEGEEPTGHLECETFEAAVRSIYDYGGTL